MATNGNTKDMYTNGNDIAQPRARHAQAINKSLARALNGELNTASTTTTHAQPSPPLPSNRSTPLPSDDAPPSEKATSAARRSVRRQQRRLFPTVDYQSRLSYFDPKSDYTDFRGFFNLFWVGLAIMGITAMLRTLKETGYLLNFTQWPLFTENLGELAASDVLMCSSTALALPLHLLFKSAGARGVLRWELGGMVVQSLFQVTWVVCWLSWPFVREWTWTAQVFFTLHSLALFMKMHSYAFYNGHLSTTLTRLRQLDRPIGPQTPLGDAVRYPKAYYFDARPAPDADENNNPTQSQLSPVMQLREDLAIEITSPMGSVTYPANLTVRNFIDYLLCPTLCYELEYPRMPQRSYMELFYKTLAVFGCIFLMTVTSEEFILPVLDSSHARLQKTYNFIDSALIFAETVSALLFPFMITFLLVFLVIFEYVLGAFAEITRFADRKFYSDWWNSQDWLEFSREWNIPVHNFFRRHVYSASRSVQVSKPLAMALTFFVSAIAHEVVMGCITRKFRGYGFVMLMLQIPFVALQRLPWVRDKWLLNNTIFWCAMCTGLSLLCALYVLV
ncbi:Sterol O-acyltransferase 2 (Sterol-ester synthase 2) [Recurvomyces mirabilis]|nr:Sterol O-acyltransferase 2 (Sterol-ester synthase 2) [Recurvomyces mirabilis]